MNYLQKSLSLRFDCRVTNLFDFQDIGQKKGVASFNGGMKSSDFRNQISDLSGIVLRNR
jgi:hypothetical protein